mmetsp:Transcript_119980/g.373673  ORF Transcript_119980/g.373673 Transcript_119980/m.373673 type:complete len:329 (-) Transcript_119980:9-995(-)
MESNYDRHRFDNPSAWLDREERARARAEGKPLGFGYAEPKEHVQPPPAKPFCAQEYSFTSGLLVNRHYKQFQSPFTTEGTRADPWHYPNAMKTQDEDHFKSHKRRSQNCDPRFWKPDPALSGGVSEHAVMQRLAADRDEVRLNLDPKRLDALFNENVRPSAETLHELNVDLSVACLPAREGGSSPSSRAPKGAPVLPPSSRGHSSAAPSARGGRAGEEAPAVPAGQLKDFGPLKKDKDSRWNWCMGGRPDLTLGQPTMRDMHLTKSRSVPTMLGGISTLTGNIGNPSSPFHGQHTRKFGVGNWDGRMRGGKLARDGWAGTFPSKEARP